MLNSGTLEEYPKILSMKKSILLIVLLVSSFSVFAAGTHYNVGARATALGQNSISFRDLWAIANNQAGIAFVDHPTLGVAYEARFQMKEMSLKTIAFVLPTNRVGNFGVSYTHFGDSEYNETRINFGYARKLGDHFAMGLAFDYIGISVLGSSEGGNTGTVTGELGIMGEPMPNLWLSAHIYNPFGVRISNYEYEEEIPTLLSFAVQYYFQKGLFVVAELEKDIDYNARVKVGIEYAFLEKCVFRGGIATQPTEYSAGLGIVLKKLHVDLAIYKHQYLGYTPSIALSYTF